MPLQKSALALVQRCLGGVQLQGSVLALVHGKKKGVDVSRGSVGASGCVVSYAYRHRPYKDPARECRYCPTAGPRELAGNEIWCEEWGVGSVELNHTKVMIPDGRWCVSLLWSGPVG